METGNLSFAHDKICLLFEAIRDEQATIFNLDWKARTILMVNSITVPLMLGILSLYSFKEKPLAGLVRRDSLVTLLLASAVLMLLTLAAVFYLTMRVISPRIGLSENVIFPEKSAAIRNLDVYFPAFKGGRADFGEYREKLQAIKDQETIELVLLSEMLSIGLIRDSKTRTLNRALVAMGINAVLMLTQIFLFLLLVF